MKFKSICSIFSLASLIIIIALIDLEIQFSREENSYLCKVQKSPTYYISNKVHDILAPSIQLETFQFLYMVHQGLWNTLFEVSKGCFGRNNNLEYFLKYLRIYLKIFTEVKKSYVRPLWGRFWQLFVFSINDIFTLASSLETPFVLKTCKYGLKILILEVPDRGPRIPKVPKLLPHTLYKIICLVYEDYHAEWWPKVYFQKAPIAFLAKDTHIRVSW